VYRIFPNRLEELEAYLQFVEKGNITSNQLLDSLEKVSVRFNYFIPTTTTYEDLKSTGNFSLFGKEERKLIMNITNFWTGLSRLLKTAQGLKNKKV
jgi:hypothetical protein